MLIPSWMTVRVRGVASNTDFNVWKNLAVETDEEIPLLIELVQLFEEIVNIIPRRLDIDRVSQVGAGHKRPQY